MLPKKGGAFVEGPRYEARLVKPECESPTHFFSTVERPEARPGERGETVWHGAEGLTQRSWSETLVGRARA